LSAIEEIMKEKEEMFTTEIDKFKVCDKESIELTRVQTKPFTKNLDGYRFTLPNSSMRILGKI
jgi:hypothetical protein